MQIYQRKRVDYNIFYINFNSYKKYNFYIGQRYYAF